MARALARARPARTLYTAGVPTVGVKAMRAVLGAATTGGLDAHALARSHDLDPAALADPDARFPHAVWVALWDEVAARCGDPALPLHAAEKLAAGHWDVIDYVVGSSDTLGDAFRRFERHFPLISTGVRHHFRVGPRDARIVREPAAGAVDSPAGAEFSFANIVLRFRRMTARPWNPTRVAFVHAPAAPLEAYARVFGGPALFRQPANEIVLPREALALPMKEAAPELCAVLDRHAVLLVARLPDETASLRDRLEHALALALRGRTPSLASVAKQLGVTERTLQRRLGEEDLSFRAVVERVREQLARRYLADPALGFGEVAFLVGFSDASAFYKAFRRWTGATPGEYREQALGARGQSIGAAPQ